LGNTFFTYPLYSSINLNFGNKGKHITTAPQFLRTISRIYSLCVISYATLPDLPLPTPDSARRQSQVHKVGQYRCIDYVFRNRKDHRRSCIVQGCVKDSQPNLPSPYLSTNVEQPTQPCLHNIRLRGPSIKHTTHPNTFHAERRVYKHVAN
jgi:hypothetical protein